MDYTSLTAAIGTWAERTYDAAQTDLFILMAEAEIDLELDGYQRETTVPLTTDADGNVALPADFISIRSIYDASEEPYRYQISGSTLFVEDGASTAFDVTYRQKLTPLTALAPTNWLIEAVPNIYLFMSLAQQRAYEEEFQAAAGFEAKGKALIAVFTMRNTVAQYGRVSLSIRQAP